MTEERHLSPYITEDYIHNITEIITPTITKTIVAKLKSTQTKQIEAAAKALFALEEPDRNSWRWDQPNPNTPANPFAWHDYWLNAARIAIEAAYTVAINGVQNEDNDD